MIKSKKINFVFTFKYSVALWRQRMPNDYFKNNLSI